MLISYIRKRTEERKKRGELRGKIDFLKSLTGPIDIKSPHYVEFYHLRDYEQELESLLSKDLLDKAHRLVIELPEDESFWYIKTEAIGGWRKKITLNEKGRDKVRKLIKEERRKNIEWLVRVIGPILTITVSILGLIVALVSLSKK